VTQNRKSIWFVLLAVFWLAGCVILYYAGHKPFDPQVALSLGRAAGQAAVAAGVLCVAGGLGSWLLPDLGVSPLAGFAIRAAFGLGALSLVVLLVAALVGFSAWLAGIGLLLGVILLRRKIALWLGGLAELARIWQAGGRLGKTIGVLAGLILAAMLVISLAPAVKFDALVYHLVLPHNYLAAGRIAYTPENIFWGMPQVGEMLYLWAIALGGDQAATCLGWGVGLLAMLGILGYARQLTGASAAWVALASLLSGYTLAAELSWGYVDWFAILFGLAFLVALQRWLFTGRASHLLLAGVFGGFAFGSKVSAGGLLLAGVILVAYHSLRYSTLRAALTNLLVFGLAGLATSLPWLLKNILATGNPLYPFLTPSGAMDAFRLSLYQGQPLWGDWRDVLFLPFRATFSGYEGAPGYSASISPLLLGLGLAYLLGRLLVSDAKLRRLDPTAAVTVIGLLIWAVSARLSGYLIQTRLYLGFFPAMALLAGGGYRVISRVRLPGVRLGRIAGALVALTLALTAIEVGLEMFSRGAPQAVAGVRSTQEYLEDNLGWYARAVAAIRQLPPEERVLMLWEPRSLYCLPACSPDEIIDRWRRDLRAWQDPQAILAAWRDAGFTHLLLHQAGVDFVRQDDSRYTPQEWQSLEELLAGLPPPQRFGEAYSLYRISP
jgi:hypothetical protein